MSAPANGHQALVRTSRSQEELPDLTTQMETATRLGHKLGGISADSGTLPMVRTKSMFGAVNDESEQEVNQVPNPIMRMSVPSADRQVAHREKNPEDEEVDQNYAERPVREYRQLAEEKPVSGEGEEIPKDKDGLAETKAESSRPHGNANPVLDLPSKTTSNPSLHSSRDGIMTTLRPGHVPETLTSGALPITDPDLPKQTIVAPGGAPAVNNLAASNDCTPSTASAVLNWNVLSADDANWAVGVTSLTLKGQINIHPWPSQPTSMVVPNTPNPVDGGNINNAAGSSNHWKAAIDDMADYNSPGGGAGPNWHSTAASSAHEWAHWNTDYVTDSVSSAAGGNWPQANADLDALREPKASSPIEAAARTALQPKVNARLATWRTRTIDRWNAIPDSPGAADGSGYAAGQTVLNGHIADVRAYAEHKGWTGTRRPSGHPRKS